MIRRLGNKIKPYRKIFVFILIFSWIFFGWLRIWQKPAIPLEIQGVRAQETIVEETEITQEIIVGETELTAEEPQFDKEAEEIEEFDDNFSPPYIPPSDLPQISVKKQERNIVIDRNATHSCQIEEFRVDLSERDLAQVNLQLQRNAAATYEIEILGLPSGIDISFSKNQSQKYQLNDENALEINIQKTSDAQEGNFNVVFVFTQKGASDSSVICQTNILNLQDDKSSQF